MSAPGQHRVGRLGEEERRLAVGVAAHLAGVLGVVASDAENAAHREAAAAGDGNRGNRGGSENIVGHGTALLLGTDVPCWPRKIVVVKPRACR